MKAQLTQMGIKVAGEAESLAAGLSLVNGLTPDIVILELPRQADAVLQAMRGIRNDHPQMGILITASDASPQVILRSMRAGAQEFLTRPVDSRELEEAIKRMASLVRRGEGAGQRRKAGKILTVFSGKGGVGVTSVATNLAVGFVQNQKKNVVMLDLNLQMGDAGLLLDLRPEYTLASTLSMTGLDETSLKGLLTKHECGLSLLAAPEDPVEAEQISPGLLLEIISLLRGMFDYIVIDAGHAFDSRVLEVMSLADTILLVAVLDVPTVRNVRRCLELFGQLGYSTEKVKLLVNRHEKRSKVTVDDLEETVENEVFWQLPNDYKTLISAIDAGVPAVIQSPRSKISRSLSDLGDELVRLYDQGGSSPAAPDSGESGEPQRHTVGR